MRCDKGYKNGECCCNCKNFYPVNAHPWNVRGFKGGIGQRIMVSESVPLNICSIQMHEKDEYRAVVAMTRDHGMCEMHTWREQ